MGSTVLKRNVPLQEQLRQILRDRIVSNHYPRGAAFPSESELAQEFNVSRATVRSALSALVAEGLLLRHRGRGTSVSPLPTISNPIGEALDFCEFITSSGFKAGIQMVSASVVKANERLAADLEIPEGSDLLRVESVFTADGSPVIYCANSIPAQVLGDDLLAETLRHPENAEPIYEFLESRCHRRVAYHIASLRAELAGRFEMDIQDFDPLTPMLVMKSIAYDVEQQPIFQSLSAYPDERMTFTLFRKRAGAG